MDEASVRDLLLGDEAVRRALRLEPEQIRDVISEGAWLAVQLDPPAVSRAVLRSVYDELARHLPERTIEVRAGNLVHRGGAGFGPRRHVIAVLGGKGGVGKSTLAVNLALTLAAMGTSTGVVDADLNAPDLPHLLGIHRTRRSWSGAGPCGRTAPCRRRAGGSRTAAWGWR